MTHSLEVVLKGPTRAIEFSEAATEFPCAWAYGIFSTDSLNNETREKILVFDISFDFTLYLIID